MKKVLLIVLIFSYVFGFSQPTAPQRVSIVNSGTNANTTTSLSATDRAYIDGLEAYQRYANDKMDSLITLVTRNNLLFKYNNDKQDSLIAAMTFTTISFTVTSANTATAVVANQTIGQGVYSLTIPAGNWQIVSAVCTSSSQTSSDLFRMLLFSGSQNIAAPAEGTAFSPSQNQISELTEAFVTSTTNHMAIGVTAFNPFFLYNSTTNYADGVVYPSGTLKAVILYGTSFTPATTNSLYIRIRMIRRS